MASGLQRCREFSACPKLPNRTLWARYWLTVSEIRACRTPRKGDAARHLRISRCLATVRCVDTRTVRGAAQARVVPGEKRFRPRDRGPTHLKCAENRAAQPERVIDRLHAWRVTRELWAPEVRLACAGGDDQTVVRDLTTTLARRNAFAAESAESAADNHHVMPAG
jgi:hypothetical protein